jgi:hypothetical protein
MPSWESDIGTHVDAHGGWRPRNRFGHAAVAEAVPVYLLRELHGRRGRHR